MSGRGFPSPWTVEDTNDAYFVVTDASGQTLGYFYFEEDCGRRSAAKLLTKEEARRIAVNFARLPDLLRSQPHWR
jgi:endo-1,4-beta-D-glucanase Y